MATEGFSGMPELIAGLARMGEHVQREAAGITRSAAQVMAARVVSQYPSHTGTLRSRVVVESLSPLRQKVRSKAPHAHLFEKGTVNRRTASTGANRGRMPARPTFIPEAVRARGRMVDELIALLKRQTVPGMTGTMEVRQS